MSYQRLDTDATGNRAGDLEPDEDTNTNTYTRPTDYNLTAMTGRNNNPPPLGHPSYDAYGDEEHDDNQHHTQPSRPYVPPNPYEQPNALYGQDPHYDQDEHSQYSNTAAHYGLNPQAQSPVNMPGPGYNGGIPYTSGSPYNGGPLYHGSPAPSQTLSSTHPSTNFDHYAPGASTQALYQPDNSTPPIPPAHQVVNPTDHVVNMNQYGNPHDVDPYGYSAAADPNYPNKEYIDMPYAYQYSSNDGQWDSNYYTKTAVLELPDRPVGAYRDPEVAETITVKLTDGNLILDCPVPTALLAKVKHAPAPQRDEFTHMRYSAVTCAPTDFLEKRFTLRQNIFAKPRQTELFIVITMYNEDELLFARTLSGVMDNIRFMAQIKANKTKTWGPDSWKKIVVCVVSDGRAKINPRTRALLAALGVYQEGIAKQKVNELPVTAHIYEYTIQMSIKIIGDVVSVVPDPAKDIPVQMLFCLKEENKKKINSHRWFFDGFGPQLNPSICVLLDAGTKPGKDSIYQLWKAFDLEPMCGGACGEIKTMLNKGRSLISPLVATQNFEYKMSNILDKPFESSFGFISVLPGAFSAYRYTALQNDTAGVGPLEKYFLGETMHGGGGEGQKEVGVFEANMYLAEDRILCFELVSKRKSHWILQYVKSATGETDVPTEMAEFISQRRRWLNGSFFAAIYAIVHCFQVFRSSHSFLRKLMFLFEFLYQTINMIFAWFALGNFFLVFRILTESLGDSTLLGKTGEVLAIVFEWMYIATLITCFVLSLGNKPSGSPKFYLGCAIFWAAIMVYLIFASVFITVRSIQEDLKDGKFEVSELVKNPLFFTLIVSMLSTYVMYFIASILFLDPWHMITCFIQYLLMTPTYINILNVYAFCNTHDVTWGTKTSGKADALPELKTKTDDSKVDFELGVVDQDIQYNKELNVFSSKVVEAPKKKDIEEKQEDFYKGFRSGTVLVWMFTNLALCAVVLQTGGLAVTVDTENQKESKDKKARIYMAVVLWSVAGLSAIRFIGCVWFLIVRLFRGV